MTVNIICGVPSLGEEPQLVEVRSKWLTREHISTALWDKLSHPFRAMIHTDASTRVAVL
jgi:hypothetical protein